MLIPSVPQNQSIIRSNWNHDLSIRGLQSDGIDSLLASCDTAQACANVGEIHRMRFCTGVGIVIERDLECHEEIVMDQ